MTTARSEKRDVWQLPDPPKEFLAVGMTDGSVRRRDRSTVTNDRIEPAAAYPSVSNDSNISQAFLGLFIALKFWVVDRSARSLSCRRPGGRGQVPD
jgi:hypothetical protein